jgi:p-aminobenzoyl-glutamate transporter AbgT
MKRACTLLCYYYYMMLSIYYCSLDTILKSIIKRQIPFLIGGTITGSIMAYYYGFLFTIIVNSIMWYVISYLVSKYYYKSKGINDQKYLIQYGLSKIQSRNKSKDLLGYSLFLCDLIFIASIHDNFPDNN